MNNPRSSHTHYQAAQASRKSPNLSISVSGTTHGQIRSTIAKQAVTCLTDRQVCHAVKNLEISLSIIKLAGWWNKKLGGKVPHGAWCQPVPNHKKQHYEKNKCIFINDNHNYRVFTELL